MSIFGNIPNMFHLKVINEYLMGQLSDYLEIFYTLSYTKRVSLFYTELCFTFGNVISCY